MLKFELKPEVICLSDTEVKAKLIGNPVAKELLAENKKYRGAIQYIIYIFNAKLEARDLDIEKFAVTADLYLEDYSNLITKNIWTLKIILEDYE